MRKTLQIWYVSALQRCNFRCAYCVTGPARLQSREEWASPMDLSRHCQVLEWIGNLPHPIRIRIASIGEPFVSDAYLDSVAKLSRSGNIEFVEILTNGSYSDPRLMRFAAAADLAKMRFWMTYHPSQIARDRFVRAALLAEERGITVVAHALLFPDTVAEVQALKTDCDRIGLKLHVGYGINFNNSYPGHGFLPILDKPGIPPSVLDMNVGFSAELYKTAEGPHGFPCSAGHDYFYIDPSGGVHRCRTYSLVPGVAPLGSVFDPAFTLKPREELYEKCGVSAPCSCVEDHSHLRSARESYVPDNTSFIPWSKAQFAARK
jgi:MoaA/NifB/PqqE/SkfB family radical SAM enzyme